MKFKAQTLRQKMADYARLLKHDGDFDYSCILDLLKFKLERTRRYIVGHHIVVDAGRIGQEIKEVEDLLGKVIKDDYDERFLSELTKKWGKLHYKNAKLPDGNYEFKYWHDKEDESNSGQIHKETRAAYRRAFAARQADLRKAFALMAKNIWGWWD